MNGGVLAGYTIVGITIVGNSRDSREEEKSIQFLRSPLSIRHQLMCLTV